MYKFDSKSRILVATKLPLKPVSNVYEESDQYKSYMQYVNVGIREDIEKLLLTKLNNIFGKDSDDRIFLDGFQVREDNTANYKGFSYYSVFVKFWYKDLPTLKAPEFCIFKIPKMDIFGVIRKDNKRYAVISQLKPSETITYDIKGKLDIQLNAAKLSFKMNGENMSVMKIGDETISIDKIIAGLCAMHGRDIHEVFSKFTSPYVVKNLNKELFETYGEYRERNMIYKSLFDNIEAHEKYSAIGAREYINDILSINAALDEVLSQDIIVNGSTIARKGDIVNENILRKCKLAHITRLYIKNVPDVSGTYLARPIWISHIPKGTIMCDALRYIVPEEDYDYCTKDYWFTEPQCIPTDTFVTYYLLEALYDCTWSPVQYMSDVAGIYHDDDYQHGSFKIVRVKDSISSQAEKVITLELDIISNGFYRESELGVISDIKEDKWVYVRDDGTLDYSYGDFLHVDDFIALYSLHYRLILGKSLELVTEKDSGLRKKVLQFNELAHLSFFKVVNDFTAKMGNKFREYIMNSNVTDLSDPGAMENMFYGLEQDWWKYLYIEMKTISRVDMTNPIAYVSSINRICTITSDPEAVSESMRYLSLGGFGKLCSFETPASKKLGLTNTKAMGCRIINGVMKTCYYRLRHIAGVASFLTDEVVWLGVEEEEKYRIADITTLNMKGDNKLDPEQIVLARVPTRDKLEKITVSYIAVKYVDFVNVFPGQSLSPTATTIPFIGSDDSARVSYELNMARQARNIVNREVPYIIAPGVRLIPRMTTCFQINAEYDGVVVAVTDSYVTVDYGEYGDTTYDYETKEFFHESIVIRTCIVTVGQKVQAGDVLVESNSTKDGLLAVGVNAIIAIANMGYNYEDGIKLSKRLQSKLTSYGSNSEEKEISPRYISTVVSPPNTFRYVNPGYDVLTLKHNLNGESRQTKVKSVKLKGFIISVNKDYDAEKKKDKSVTIKTLSFNPVKQGDKMANRHGNKGVTPMIAENVDMPYLTNGEFIDVVYSPNGIPSRMIIGQLKECHTGLAAMVLNLKVEVASFDDMPISDIAMLLSYAWDLANRDDYQNVPAEYPAYPKEMHDYCLSQIDWIKIWKGTFNKQGKAKLINPATGKFFEDEVVIGVNYVYKEVQEISDKVHARGGYLTEPYVDKMNAPTKGAAELGGQSYGYMEIDGLAGYGACNFIDELKNERSDNGIRRNNFTVNIAHSGSDAYKLDDRYAIKRSNEYFLSTMLALGVNIEFDEEEGIPNFTLENNKHKAEYTRSALVTSDVKTHKEEIEDIGNQELSDLIRNLS